jgi:3-phosphoshikimate 1-carboxyvinyltransferase
VQVTVSPLPHGVPADLGSPRLPGSKSHTQRALILAAFLPGIWRLLGAQRSSDTATLCQALQRLGAAGEAAGEDFVVQGGVAVPHGAIDTGENATALRMLGIVVPMLGGQLTADGAEGLRRRPHAALFGALAGLGVRVPASWPLRIEGGARRLPDALRIDASRTGQVASGALLGAALCLARGERAPAIVAQRPSAPGYLRVTASVLSQFGFETTLEPTGEDLACRVSARREAAGTRAIRIPPDASAAAFPLALAAMHRLAAPALGQHTADPHPDWHIAGDLALLQAARAGAELVLDPGSRPDTFPALAAAAARRDGATRFVGLAALRGKESDRIHAIAAGLQDAGLRCDEAVDGLVVRGPLPDSARTLVLRAPADHRIIMALALLGTCTPGGVTLDHARSVAKSWPDYFGWLARVARVACATP